MIRKVLKNQKGMSLLEMVAAVAIAGLVTTAFGSIGYSMLRSGDYTNAQVAAASGIEEAARQLSIDGQSAQNIDLVAGASPVASVTLSWMDPSNGNTHSVAYSLSGQNLRRTASLNGVVQSQRTAAGYITSVSFSMPSGQTDLFKMGIVSSGGSARVSQTKEYYVTLRAQD